MLRIDSTRLKAISRKRVLIRSIVLVLLAISVPQMFPLHNAKALSSDPTSLDTYRGSWFGVRPTVTGGGITYFDQSVYQYGRAGGNAAEISVAASVYSLDQNHGGTSSEDWVSVRVLTNTNSRLPIAYNFRPNQSPTVGFFCGATDSGAHGDDVTAQVPIQGSGIDFFGSVGTTSGLYWQNLWVSSNGFLSFTDNVAAPTPSSKLQVKPNAVVAPFWRDLYMDGSSSIKTSYDSSSQLFYVTWCNMIVKATQTRASFMVIFHEGGFNPNTIIEFVYDTNVNPNDGVPTLVGLRDESGTRPYLFPANYCAAAGCIVIPGKATLFIDTYFPNYINHLDVSVSNNGDNNAKMTLDPTSPISGINVVTNTAADTQVLPRYIRDGIADIALGADVLGLEVGPGVDTPFLAAGVILDGVVFVNDQMENVLNHFNQASNPQITQAFNNGDHTLDVDTAVMDTYQTGIDASLGVTFDWRLTDPCKCIDHTLTITSTAYYTADTRHTDQGSSTPVSTSVTLDMQPGAKLKTLDFQSGIPSDWTVGDTDSLGGGVTWGAVGLCYTRCYQGGKMIGSASGYPGTSAQSYVNEMNSYLQTYTPTYIAGYGNLYLYFKAWINTEPGDNFYVDYYDGIAQQWVNQVGLSGALSLQDMRTGGLGVGSPQGIQAQQGGGSSEGMGGRSGWMSFRVALPSGTSGIRFRFQSDASGVAEGVYLAAVYLMATTLSPSNSYDIEVRSALSSGSTSKPISGMKTTFDGQSGFTPAGFSATTGTTHTAQAESCLEVGPNMMWRFDHWSDGTTANPASLNVQHDMLGGAAFTAVYVQAPGNCSAGARQLLRPDGDMFNSGWNATPGGPSWSAVNGLVLRTDPVDPSHYIQASYYPGGQPAIQQLALSDVYDNSPSGYALQIWVYVSIDSPSTESVPLIINMYNATGSYLVGLMVYNGATPGWYSSQVTSNSYSAAVLNGAYLRIQFGRAPGYRDPTARIYAIYVEDPPPGDPPLQKCFTICPT